MTVSTGVVIGIDIGTTSSKALATSRCGTRYVEQPSADRRFEFAPQRVGAPQQGDVRGVLEISQPDDAR